MVHVSHAYKNMDMAREGISLILVWLPLLRVSIRETHHLACVGIPAQCTLTVASFQRIKDILLWYSLECTEMFVACSVTLISQSENNEMVSGHMLQASLHSVSRSLQSTVSCIYLDKKKKKPTPNKTAFQA